LEGQCGLIINYQLPNYFEDMPIYKDSNQLYTCAEAFFNRMREVYPKAEDDVKKAKALILVKCPDLNAEFLINGRRTPVEIAFGPSKIRPEVEVEMSSDTLHNILLGQLSLPKAVTSKQMKVKGPVWKTFSLAGIFERGQDIYPDILKEQEVF
jgi:hypothetical protein